MPERLPPNNVEAEQSVLGSILIDPTAIAVVEPILRASDFYRQGHAAIYEAMRSLYARNVEADFVTICDELDQANTTGISGGPTYIASLLDVTPTAVHVESYAKIVKRASMQRRLIAIAQAMVTSAYDEEEPRDTIEKTEVSLSTLLAERLEDKYSWSTAETLAYTYKILDKYSQAWEGGRSPNPTIPWPGVAQFVPWLRPGLPAVLAAPTAGGKTTLCENLAEGWAQDGWNVVYFHYELPIETLIARRYCRYTGVSITAFEKGLRVLESGRAEVTQRAVEDWVHTWPGNVQYVHCEGWPIRRIVSEAEALWRQGLCDVFIVDYLSKAPFVPSVVGETTAQMVGRDVNMLKNFCESRRVCALLVSQYNNQGGLRNSGEIEQLSNLVLKVEKVSDDRLKVVVSKNTLGKTGECMLHMDFSRFRVLG